MLVTTLFFVLFSGLFSQVIINTSSNQMAQMKQVTSSYQVRSALNMGKEILEQEIERNGPPVQGTIRTSQGTINISRRDEAEIERFILTIQTDSGSTKTEEYIYSIPSSDTEINEKPEESKEEARHTED